MSNEAKETKKFKEGQIWWSRNMGKIVIMEIDDRGVMTGKIFNPEWGCPIDCLLYEEDEDGKHYATSKYRGGWYGSPNPDYDLMSLEI